MKIFKLNFNIFLFILIIILFLLPSCADVQSNLEPCLKGHIYGFWGGLWHGIIAPISFIGSLFSKNIDVYALNNNGGCYTFGFLLGIGAFSYSIKK